MHPKEKPIAWVGMFMLAEGDAAPAPRARVRRRLELGQVGEVARGQLRLRPREHQGAAVVERPRCTRCSSTNPKAVTLAERVPRPRHPAARALRQDVGGGEGLLTRRAAGGVAGASEPPARAARPDDAEPARPAARLARRLLPRADRDRRRLQLRRLLARSRGRTASRSAAWHDFLHSSIYLKLFWKSVKMSLIVSAIIVVARLPARVLPRALRHEAEVRPPPRS